MICDIEKCKPSECTVDVLFFDLANNKQALRVLKLAYLSNLNGYWAERERWFANYLLQFDAQRERIDRIAANEKLMRNPMLRILFFDKNNAISFANSLQ